MTENFIIAQGVQKKLFPNCQDSFQIKKITNTISIFLIIPVFFYIFAAICNTYYGIKVGLQ